MVTATITMVVRTDKMTYTFNLGPQQTRTFNKPM